jgi:uncharacterized membrane protein (DUF2068 family)
MTDPAPLTGLRAIALFKGSRAFLVLLAALWLLQVAGSDVHAMAVTATAHLHLNPEWRATQFLLEKAATVTDANIWMVICMGFGYALLRGTEAIGLWRGLVWAEWFTFASGGIYIPMELWSMAHGINWVNSGALLLSLTITGYVGWMLFRSKRRTVVPNEAVAE